MNILKDKIFLRFVAKFILIFCICYYGTLAIIGLAAPKGYYIPFVQNYLNYVGWLRSSLLHGSQALLSFFGIQTYFASEYNLKMVNGRGIVIVYECVGYGIMSFWIAFVLASDSTVKRKLAWLLSGLLFLWVLNICRLSLLLIAINKGWPIPLGWDHHTWFNIIAYIFIFVLIYIFYKTSGANPKKQADSK